MFWVFKVLGYLFLKFFLVINKVLILKIMLFVESK